MRQLTAAVRLRSEDAARPVHWGATSQDLLDTALVLQMREALALISEDLERLDGQLLQRVEEHAHAMAGRTWLQQGPPITLDEDCRMAGRHPVPAIASGCRQPVNAPSFCNLEGLWARLRRSARKGLRFGPIWRERSNLTEPDLPWHTHRDNWLEVATVLGLLACTLGKIARDVSLLMETEIGGSIGAMDRGARRLFDHAA